METKEHRHGLATGNVLKDANFWQYKLIVDIRRLFLEMSSIWSGVDEIDDFAVFPLLYLLVGSRNKVDIIVHYDNSPFCLHQ